MNDKESLATQQLVEIEDIKDGIIILKNGALRRVLMVAGINFELKSEEEQNIILSSFQNFINGLDFSVQFVIHSRKLNTDSYLEKLNSRRDEEENELLKNQISEYIEFIRSYVETNAVMTKNFFAIVPFDPIAIQAGGNKLFDVFKFGSKSKNSAVDQSEEQKIFQLGQRTDQVVSGLNQIGLRAVPLNDEEIIELFYNLYNPATIEKQDLKLAKK